MVVRQRGRYGVSTVGFLRTGIAAYRGPSALVKELVQNADDARASRLEFKIQADALIVTNDGTFSNRDFASIKEIASGGKRDDAEATGTWGTGFTSIYQVTDRPEIRSAGRYLALEPLVEGCEEGEDEKHVPGTEFRFPWRQQESALSRAIEVGPWKTSAVDELHRVLRQEMFQNILFLLHVNEIVVQDARHRIPVESLRIRRTRLASPGKQPNIAGTDFSVTSSDQPEWQGRWTFVSRQAVNPPTRWEGNNAIQLKRSLTELAFGDAPPGAACEGLVYNTLPTPVRTGFRFQINADFYPTADRSAIVMTDDEKGRWNTSLVKTLATLAADHLETMRDTSGGPEPFYELLPTSCAAGADFLQVIVDKVREAARTGSFVCTVGGWQRPSIARTPLNERIIRIVEPEGERLPEITLTRLRPGLQDYFGVRDYGLQHIALRLREQLRAGTALDAAPPAIASHERLSYILREFDRELSRVSVPSTSGGSSPAARLHDLLRALPLALDEEGRLQRMGDGVGNARLVPSQLRPLIPPGAFLLIDEAVQRTHERFYQRFARPLSVAEVVAALKNRASELRDRPLAEAPAFLSAPGRLQELWKAMAHAALDGRLTAELLDGAPIVLDQSGVLRQAGPSATKPTFVADDETAPLFSVENVNLLHSSLEEFEHVWRLADVQRVMPASAAQALAAWCEAPRALELAPASINSVAKLTTWYRYLGAHAERIPTAHRTALRAVAVVLTSQGLLASAGKHGELLSLPWTETPHPEFDALTRDIAHLVAPEIIDDSTRYFLQQVLGIAPLTIDRYLIHHVLPYVAQGAQERRTSLLHALRDELLRLRGGPQLEVIRAMRDTALIPDQHGVLCEPGDIYDPSADLTDVFATPWRQPAPELFRDDDDPDERKAWSEFFTLLGLPRKPLPEDLVQAARAISQSNPQDSVRRNQALSILSRLNADWQDLYQHSHHALAPLRDLRWLPALNRDGWFKPAELLPATFAELVLSQAAVLVGRGRQIGGELSGLLGMPTTAPFPAVVAHLLHLGASGDTREPTAIYGYLDQPHILRDASQALRTLVDKPVIFNARSKVWYSPHHTYLADVSADFGVRRLSLPDQQQYLGLFKAMGVRIAIAPLDDALELLLEIDREVQESEGHASEAAVVAVQRAHRLLLRARADAPDTAAFQQRCTGLIEVYCIPGAGSRLHRPGDIFINDLASVSDWFPGMELPLALVSGDQGSAHEHLLQDMGVKRLSQATRSAIVDATGVEQDREWTLLFAALAAPFQRICESRDHREGIDWRKIEVARVARLSVRRHLDGERRRLVSETIPVEAAYDREGSRLLVTQSVRNSRDLWPIAREVAQLIEPRRPSDVTTTVHAVLELALAGKGPQIEHYLDAAQYRRGWRADLTLDVDEAERASATGQIGSLADRHTGESPTWTAEDLTDTTALAAAESGTARQTSEPTWSDTRDERAASEANPPPAPAAEKERDIHPQPRGVGQLGLSFGEGADRDRATTPRAVQRATAIPLPDAPQPPERPQQTNGLESQSASVAGALAPEPAVPAAPGIPPFLGRPAPNTPVIPTDWVAIARRFPDVFTRSSSDSGLTESAPAGSERPTGGASPGRSPGLRAEDVARLPIHDTVHTCHFTLSGTGMAQGFLSLGSRYARAMLANERHQINVRTDEDDEFPLYIHNEWEVLYNHEALPGWFERNLIPAGARIALARESAGVYRIYPLPGPARHIENLRILEWVDDRLEVHSGVAREVAHEIDEAVYRAEIRLEDPKALAVQAAGGQSIFHILVNLLADAAEPLPEAWLIETVHGIRQVSASTVPRELHQSVCFTQVADPPHHWRFDADLLLTEHARRNGLPHAQVASRAPGWERDPGVPVTWPDVGRPQEFPALSPEWASALAAMSDALELLGDRNLLSEVSPNVQTFGTVASRFIRAFRRVERVCEEFQRQADAGAAPPEASSSAQRWRWMLDALHQTHGEDVVTHPDYAALLSEMIEAADDPEVRELFAEEISRHTLTAWDAVIRPLLEREATRLREQGAFATGRWLYELDQRLAGRDRAANLAELDRMELGAGLLASLDPRLTGHELADELVQVLQLAPDMEGARVKLQIVARQIAQERRRKVADHLQRHDVDAASATLHDVGAADARWAASLGQHHLAASELEHIALDLFSTVFELAGDSQRSVAERAHSAALALTAVQQFVPADRRDARLKINMVALLDQVTANVRSGNQPLLALATELSAWRMIMQVAGTKSVSVRIAIGRYERLERLATRLGIHDVALTARRKHCERLEDMEKRRCFQRYTQMNSRQARVVEESMLTRMALYDQLLATTPKSEIVRAILGDELVTWLQHDAPANLVG